MRAEPVAPSALDGALDDADCVPQVTESQSAKNSLPKQMVGSGPDEVRAALVGLLPRLWRYGWSCPAAGMRPRISCRPHACGPSSGRTSSRPARISIDG